MTNYTVGHERCGHRHRSLRTAMICARRIVANDFAVPRVVPRIAVIYQIEGCCQRCGYDAVRLPILACDGEAERRLGSCDELTRAALACSQTTPPPSASSDSEKAA